MCLDFVFQNKNDCSFPLEQCGSPQLPACMLFLNVFLSPEGIEALCGPFPSCWKMIDAGTPFNPSKAECLKLWGSDPTDSKTMAKISVAPRFGSFIES